MRIYVNGKSREVAEVATSNETDELLRLDNDLKFACDEAEKLHNWISERRMEQAAIVAGIRARITDKILQDIKELGAEITLQWVEATRAPVGSPARTEGIALVAELRKKRTLLQDEIGYERA